MVSAESDISAGGQSQILVQVLGPQLFGGLSRGGPLDAFLPGVLLASHHDPATFTITLSAAGTSVVFPGSPGTGDWGNSCSHRKTIPFPAVRPYRKHRFSEIIERSLTTTGELSSDADS